MEGGWGDYKQDYRIGQLCQILANVNRNTKKKSSPFTIEEFSLRPKEQNRKNPKEAEKRIRHSLDGLAGVKAGKKRRK